MTRIYEGYYVNMKNVKMIEFYLNTEMKGGLRLYFGISDYQDYDPRNDMVIDLDKFEELFGDVFYRTSERLRSGGITYVNLDHIIEIKAVEKSKDHISIILNDDCESYIKVSDEEDKQEKLANLLQAQRHYATSKYYHLVPEASFIYKKDEA